MTIHVNNPTVAFPDHGVRICNTNTNEEYFFLYSTISAAYHSENTIYIYSKLGLNLEVFFEDSELSSYTVLKRTLNTKPYYRPSVQTSAPGPASTY